MKEEEVLRCQIQEWYPRFRSISIRTHIHKLPNSFISYLLQDENFLSRSNDALPSRHQPQYPDPDYQHWDEEDDDTDEPTVPQFPDLEQEINESIYSLGGRVLPKLNWSAPKDSAWISPSRSLRCSNFDEIVLLLKASDAVVHDLCHGFDNCDDKVRERPDEVVLALRKWYDLRPEREFRAFVRGGVLLGLCQREITGYYPSLLQETAEFEAIIYAFFIEELCGKFDGDDYTFDCYVTKDGKVKLLDFNSWGGSTLPLLFSWDELEENYANLLHDGPKDLHVNTENDSSETGNVISFSSSSYRQGEKVILNKFLRDGGHKVEIRVVEEEGIVRPNLAAVGGIPMDYVNSGPGSAWDEFLRRAEEEYKEQCNGNIAGG